MICTENLNDFKTNRKLVIFVLDHTAADKKALNVLSSALFVDSKCVLLQSTFLYLQAYHVVRTPCPCWNRAFYYFVLWLELQF